MATGGPTTLLRPFRPEDVPDLIALFRDTVRRVNRRDYTREQVEIWAPDAIDAEAWARRLAGRFVAVAEIDGRVAGFADLEATGLLDRLFVHADHQGRGVGRALVAAVEGEARRLALARVVTDASITARPFFERQGFATLREQVVVLRDVPFVNYRMEKGIATASGA